MNEINQEHFYKTPESKQAKGHYKTKLYLKGNIECQCDHKTHYVDGIYYVRSRYNSGTYGCISATGEPIIAKHKDLRQIILHVYYSDDMDNWTKPLSIFSHDNKQYVDTFNGTLWYVVGMFLVSFLRVNIFAWITLTVFYIIWRKNKYN